MPYFVIQSLCWGTHTLELCQCKALNRFDTEGILCPGKSPSTYFAPQSTINLPRSQKSIFNRGHWSILKNIDFWFWSETYFDWKEKKSVFELFPTLVLLWPNCISSKALPPPIVSSWRAGEKKRRLTNPRAEREWVSKSHIFLAAAQCLFYFPLLPQKPIFILDQISLGALISALHLDQRHGASIMDGRTERSALQVRNSLFWFSLKSKYVCFSLVCRQSSWLKP